MAAPPQTDPDPKAAARAVWAAGDYHAFAKATIWPLGPILVDACSIGRGTRMLDVAAGTGNVAIRAAEAGADVVASDLTPEQLAVGRREAEARGVRLEWVEADAEALPFADASFDTVTSAFGAIFAPDHERVAAEMLRVCRPGGVIGMLNFAPEPLAVDFFETVARHLPGPAGDEAPSPLAWGDERHVRRLLGGGTSSLRLTRGEYVERADDAGAYRDLLRETFGPVITAYRANAGDPEGIAALDRDLLALATRRDSGRPGGPAEYRYAYLLVVARRR